LASSVVGNRNRKLVLPDAVEGRRRGKATDILFPQELTEPRPSNGEEKKTGRRKQP